jgi:precorrin-2 methylase
MVETEVHVAVRATRSSQSNIKPRQATSSQLIITKQLAKQGNMLHQAAAGQPSFYSSKHTANIQKNNTGNTISSTIRLNIMPGAHSMACCQAIASLPQHQQRVQYYSTYKQQSVAFMPAAWL